VIVTGAGGVGCGRAIARRFAAEGASVIASDINETGADGMPDFFRADVRDERQVHELIDFAVQRSGRLSVLVNNASQIKPPSDPLGNWLDTIEVDLLGTLHATRFAIDAMRRSGGGAIVNIGSISALWHGRRKPGGWPAYDLAKAAIIRLTTSLAWLAEKENIRVNCLAPGWIGTPEVRSYWESLTPEQRLERGVPSKLLDAEQIAELVLRIASDTSLAGRVVVWWSESRPQLIPWADPGYSELENY